jgi:UDP-N-acetylglucosamine 4,6-dehydratase/UDP-glucose 4-epimerase
MLDTSKKYLITGGAGFLGQELIKRLTDMGCKNLVTVSRNEGKLIELKEKFPHVQIITGNITDPHIIEKVCAGVSGIFHAAAFKHVGLAERENVRECVLSNVYGSMALLDETRKTKPDFIIGISTDKAAQVTGTYGATKFLMERLFDEFSDVNPDTKHRVVRYGNVLYSTGSVLCKWRDKLSRGEEIVVTDPEATRFFWTAEQAVDLVFDCLNNAKDSKPYVTQMKAIKIGDLLEAMMDKYGHSPVRYIGLQVGENLHEKIVSDGQDSSQAERYTKEEITKLI